MNVVVQEVTDRGVMLTFVEFAEVPELIFQI